MPGVVFCNLLRERVIAAESGANNHKHGGILNGLGAHGTESYNHDFGDHGNHNHHNDGYIINDCDQTIDLHIEAAHNHPNDIGNHRTRGASARRRDGDPLCAVAR